MRPLFPVLLALASCGPKPSSVDDFHTSDLMLPGGQVIKIETMIDSRDILRGLMFRASLAPDHGMLFVYPSPDKHPYWMYQTLIPLDIIWMDGQHHIVEIIDKAEPCKTVASKCPTYGGKEKSQYVLELAGGMAKKYGLKLGETVIW